MERQRRVRNSFLGLNWLKIILLLFVFSCSRKLDKETIVKTELTLSYTPITTKAMMPDENKLKDIHLFLFNEHEHLEQVKHLRISDFQKKDTGLGYNLNLIKNKKYIIYVCANLDYNPIVTNLEDLNNIYCYLAFPDDYSQGIPMSGKSKIFEAGSTQIVEIELERLMAKLSLKMDRSLLAEDVSITVKGVQVGNCPKTAKVFSVNTVDKEDMLFVSGFYLDEMDCWNLNKSLGNYTSDVVDLYILENIQGEIHNPENSANGKYFKNDDPKALYTSYVEIEMDYKSKFYQTSDKRLKYRFYLGENHRDINVERNSHYKITICPTNDGLDGNSWRIDKSGLEEINQAVFFNVYPSSYIKSYVGEDVYVWCEYSPSYASFDIGLEELEFDKARGIYDYTIDDNGKGVTLHLKKPGSGILYFSFGHPINDSAMVYVEVIK